jgi:hypothetical protein
VARTLYTGLGELDGPVAAVVVVVGFGLFSGGNSRIVGGRMESIRLRLVVGCGLVGMVVGVVVVAAGRRVRNRLPWLVGIWEMRPGCMRVVR